MDRLNGLHGGVLAAEGFEMGTEKRLHPERDAGHAKVLVKLRGAGGEGGGVGFKGDFLKGGKIECFAESLEEAPKMSGRKHGGSSAAEVDCFERWKIFFGSKAGLGKEGIDEGPEVGFARSVLVEGTIWADAMAEGDVKVEMHSSNVEHRTLNTQR